MKILESVVKLELNYTSRNVNVFKSGEIFQISTMIQTNRNVNINNKLVGW